MPNEHITVNLKQNKKFSIKTREILRKLKIQHVQRDMNGLADLQDVALNRGLLLASSQPWLPASRNLYMGWIDEKK